MGARDRSSFGPMRVLELWRYPVKSMQGERLDVAEVGPPGLTGDRPWAIVDGTTGLALTARREPRLLFASGRRNDDDTVTIDLPDGSSAWSDDDLSRWLGRPVSLQRAGTAGTYEIATDFEDEAASEWVQWTGPDDTYHDSARARVSILSTGSMRGWDRRRFRANVIVDGKDGDEDRLVGSQVTVGACRLDVVTGIDRCVMTTRPQPGGIERDLDVLRTINAERRSLLAVGAGIVTPGTVAVGDEMVAAVPG